MAMENFLDQLAWTTDPWSASHQGAGVFAARVITGEADAAWQRRYFQWLDQEVDEVTGFWRRGSVAWSPHAQGKPIFHHLAGSFHYLFNQEWARWPLRHPAAMVDSCLRLWNENHWSLGQGLGFAEIDWIYCLNRAWRQSGHRTDEVVDTLETMATFFVTRLHQRLNVEPVPFPDLHSLFGTLCALAELQSALPGRLRSEKPLKLVLDRRPFI
ncbi:MAG: hypothetical protein HC904_15320 [Blastochloris sp.]|nr:hypothetical protein [Blastochloris sp.]